MAPARQWKRRVQNNSTNMSKSKYRKLSTLLLQLNDKMDTIGSTWNQKFDQLSSNVKKNGSSVDARIEPHLAEIQNRVKEVSRELDLTISMCQKSKDIEVLKVVPEVAFSLGAFQFRKKVDVACGSNEHMLGSFKKAVTSFETQTTQFDQSKTPKLSYYDGQTQTSEEPASKKASKSNFKHGNVKSRLFDNLDDDVLDKETDSPFREKSPERLVLIEQEVFKSRSRILRSPLNGASNRTPRYEPRPSLVRDELRSSSFFNLMPGIRTIPSTIAGSDRKRASTLPISSVSTYFKGTPPIRSKDFSLTRKIVGYDSLGATGLSRSRTFLSDKQYRKNAIEYVEITTAGSVGNETFSLESSSKITRDDEPTRNYKTPTTSDRKDETQNVSDRNKETSHVVTSTSGNSERAGSNTSIASLNNNDDHEEINVRPSSTSSFKSLFGASTRRPSSTISPALFKSGVKMPSRTIGTPVFVVSRQESPVSIQGASIPKLDSYDSAECVKTPLEGEGPSMKKRRKVTTSKPVTQRGHAYNTRYRTNTDKTG